MTGRQAIEQIAGAEGLRVLKVLRRNGFAVVPIEPTAEMVEGAYEYAMTERAADVWRKMIADSLAT